MITGSECRTKGWLAEFDADRTNQNSGWQQHAVSGQAMIMGRTVQAEMAFNVIGMLIQIMGMQQARGLGQQQQQTQQQAKALKFSHL